MAGNSILADLSRYLLECLREALCPSVLPARELVALNAPDVPGRDALVNLYLYDVREQTDCAPGRQIPLLGQAREAPFPLTARYLAFCGHQSQAPSDGLLEPRVLGRIFQAVRALGPVDIAAIHEMADDWDEPVALTFTMPDDRLKMDLWNGFSQPLRPAVYFEAGPLLIAGDPVSAVRAERVSTEVKSL